MSEGRGPDGPLTFGNYLRDLKRRGSNLLVTGSVSDAVSALATRTLFGTGERRYRVLALLDPVDEGVSPRLPDGVSVDDPDFRLVDRRTGVRSASAASVVNGTTPFDTEALSDRVGAAIEGHDEEANGFDPAELRVGVHSLSVLLRKHDLRTVHRFVRSTSTDVYDVNGMAHYHFPVADDDPVVESLDPLFDARIELRKEPGRSAEHRWHVPELGATDWVPL